MILISGLPHSGTRLALEIVKTASNVNTYSESLNEVGEVPILHHYFVKLLDETSINKKVAKTLDNELKWILEQLCRKANNSEEVLKLPYYPIKRINVFKDVFDEVKILSCERDIERVIKSFERRGEHHTLFTGQEARLRQIKKLNVEYRGSMIHNIDFREWMHHLRSSYEKEKRELKNGDSVKVYEWDILHIAESKNYMEKRLNEIGLKVDDTSEAHKKVDIERLRQKRCKIKEMIIAFKNKIKAEKHKIIRSVIEVGK